ncbi:uncharacterized protein BJ171DRAFT_572011 [Polychytrium aggregatum]|uniref:uncharacterized protein n=1 Tax=Polychytrium aggregatum TaxID=110093 RepID=UPI0022FE5B2C|nr:uncharacterized protein BJ171DRAFT_572011 [Polychytrium aggregatum]KAI9193400.1 hypothetical protein BJ171DRAFT_572011 [Polychytrium aggregatum]
MTSESTYPIKIHMNSRGKPHHPVRSPPKQRPSVMASHNPFDPYHTSSHLNLSDTCGSGARPLHQESTFCSKAEPWHTPSRSLYDALEDLMWSRSVFTSPTKPALYPPPALNSADIVGQFSPWRARWDASFMHGIVPASEHPHSCHKPPAYRSESRVVPVEYPVVPEPERSPVYDTPDDLHLRIEAALSKYIDDPADPDDERLSDSLLGSSTQLLSPDMSFAISSDLLSPSLESLSVVPTLCIPITDSDSESDDDLSQFCFGEVDWDNADDFAEILDVAVEDDWEFVDRYIDL